MCTQARLAQLVERKTLNLVVVGSSPTVGVFLARSKPQRPVRGTPLPKHRNFKRHCVRVVKELDSKSNGLCPQGFESPRCRFLRWCFRKALVASLQRETLGAAAPCVSVWPSGLRRQTQVLVERSAWVRTPQLTFLFRAITISQREEQKGRSGIRTLDLLDPNEESYH
jgi:hypothetical protein